jgi:uncharacterized protein with FMN-binding domain
MFPKRGALATLVTIALVVFLLNFKTSEPASSTDLLAIAGPTGGSSLPAIFVAASPSLGPSATIWPSSSDASRGPTAADATATDTLASAANQAGQPPARGSTPAALIPPTSGKGTSPGGPTAPPIGQPPLSTTPRPGITPSLTPAPPAAPTPPPTPAPPAGYTGSINGAVEQTKYGPMQVRVVYSGGRIRDVVTLQMTNQSSRSTAISQRACPILRSEALKAQSAAIDTVSGAAYTSDGYKASLQAAIAQKP